MNYLSHYHFFKRENDAYHTCGLIFPDWLATYKRTRFHHTIQTNNPFEESLKVGVESHFLGDKMFHGSEYFKEYSHGIKLLLEHTKLDKDHFRFSFLSHVILEMMIDRLLLLQNPNLGLNFYDELDSCDNQQLLLFAQSNSPVDDGFITLVEKFKHYRFLLQYIKTDNFVYSLNRIAGKVGIQINEDQGMELMQEMGAIEHYVEESLPELFRLFKTGK